MNTDTTDIRRLYDEKEATAMEEETEKAIDRGLRPKNVPLTDAEYDAIQPLNRRQRRAWLKEKLASMSKARKEGVGFPDLSASALEMRRTAENA